MNSKSLMYLKAELVTYLTQLEPRARAIKLAIAIERQRIREKALAGENHGPASTQAGGKELDSDASNDLSSPSLVTAPPARGTQASEEVVESMSNKDFVAAVKTNEAIIETKAKLFISKGLSVDYPMHQDADSSWGPRCTLLHLAAEYGYTSAVEFLLEHGANINAENSNESTPLELAVRENHIETVRELLASGASIDDPHNEHYYMHNARSKEVVSLLLRNGIKIDAKDTHGRTPLHWAVKSARESIVHIFIDKGADVNATDSEGKTALHFAAKDGMLNIVQILIAAGANVNASDIDGRTPLTRAIEKGDEDVIKCLLECGADVKASDSTSPVITATEVGELYILEILIARGANLDAQDGSGKTALYLAAEANRISFVALLLEKGANSEFSDSEGRTPLYIAQKNHYDGISSLLLRHGAKIIDRRPTPPDGPDNPTRFFRLTDNQVSVMTACGRISLDGDDDSIKDAETSKPSHGNGEASTSEPVTKPDLLQVNQTYTFISSGRCLAVMHYGAQTGNTRLIKALLKGGATVDLQEEESGQKFTPLQIAAMNGRVESLKVFIKAKYSVNATSKDGWTPLHLAAQNGHLEAVKILIGARAKINVLTNTKRTPLHQAAQNGHVEVVDKLIKKRAVINAAEESGWIALHLAANFGHPNIVEMLLNAGANLNACSRTKRTALHQAAEKGNLNVVELLVRKGASIDAQDDQGMTPAALAEHNGHREVCEFLHNVAFAAPTSTATKAPERRCVMQ